MQSRARWAGSPIRTKGNMDSTTVNRYNAKPTHRRETQTTIIIPTNIENPSKMVRIKSDQVKKRDEFLHERKRKSSFKSNCMDFLSHPEIVNDEYCCEACEQTRFKRFKWDDMMEESLNVPMEGPALKPDSPKSPRPEADEKCGCQYYLPSETDVPCLQESAPPTYSHNTYAWSDLGESSKTHWECLKLNDEDVEPKKRPTHPLPEYPTVVKSELDYNLHPSPPCNRPIRDTAEAVHAFRPYKKQEPSLPDILEEIQGLFEPMDSNWDDILSVTSDSLDNLEGEKDESSQEEDSKKATKQSFGRVLKPHNDKYQTLDDIYDDIPVSSGISLAGDLESSQVSDFEEDKEEEDVDKVLDDIMAWVLESEQAKAEANQEIAGIQENLEENWPQDDINDSLSWLSKEGFSPPVGKAILDIPKEDETFYKAEKSDKTDDEKVIAETLLELSNDSSKNIENSAQILMGISKARQESQKPRHRIKRRQKQNKRNQFQRRRLYF